MGVLWGCQVCRGGKKTEDRAPAGSVNQTPFRGGTLRYTVVLGSSKVLISNPHKDSRVFGQSWLCLGRRHVSFHLPRRRNTLWYGSDGSDVGSGAESGAEGVRICLYIVKLITLIIFLLLWQVPVTLQEEKFAWGHSYRGFRPLPVGMDPSFQAYGRQ